MSRLAVLMLVAPLLVALTTSAGAPPNVEKALAAQQQLISERPYDAAAYNDLGNLLSLAGRVEDAEDAYRKAIEIDPGDSSARFNLSVLLQQIGRERAAATELRNLLDQEPGNAWAHYQLGVLLEKRGPRSRAIEEYARAFALDPGLTFASNNPHIIDNELFTEALLVSKRYRSTESTQTPRQYGDPGRIADLMLTDDESKGDSAAAESTVEDEEDEEEEEGRRQRRRKRSDGEAEGSAARGRDGGSAQDSGRRSGDVTRRSSTASGSSLRDSTATRSSGSSVRTRTPLTGTTVGAPRSTGGSANAGRAVGESTTRSRDQRPTRVVVPRPPASSGTDGSSAQGASGTDESSTRRAPVGGRRANRATTPTRYRPGRGSTARLELRLLPADEPPSRQAVGP